MLLAPTLVVLLAAVPDCASSFPERANLTDEEKAAFVADCEAREAQRRDQTQQVQVRRDPVRLRPGPPDWPALYEKAGRPELARAYRERLERKTDVAIVGGLGVAMGLLVAGVGGFINLNASVCLGCPPRPPGAPGQNAVVGGFVGAGVGAVVGFAAIAWPAQPVSHEEAIRVVAPLFAVAPVAIPGGGALAIGGQF